MAERQKQQYVRATQAYPSFLSLFEVRRKKNPAALLRVRFESFCEGLAAQILHIGPYTAEAPTIQRLHDFIQAQGGSFDGLVHKHHEIYLGNPQSTAPEKLKTVIRQPFFRLG